MKMRPCGLWLLAIAVSFCGGSVGADEKPVTSLDEILAQPFTFSVESEPFLAAVGRLTKEVQAGLPKKSPMNFEIRILGNDLKSEGLTQNQRIRSLMEGKRPLRAILTALVQAANANIAVKDPSDPRQRVVWVIGPSPSDPENQIILITTRRMTQVRSYKLPDKFISQD